MIITKLTPGVHDSNRVNIFVDGRFNFSLNIAQVVDLGIKVNQQVTPEQLKKYRQASEFGKLYQSTLEWLLARPRSIFETRQHLKQRLMKRKIINRRIVQERAQNHNAKRKELPLFTEEDIEAVIARLKERSYLDDERFARYFLENRNVARGVSNKKLRLDLQKKGIDKKLIEQLMAENIRSDDEEIKKIIAKKAKKYDRNQLIAYLVRHGFGYQLAQDAVDEMDLQNPA